jgi:hypothetical protein
MVLSGSEDPDPYASKGSWQNVANPEIFFFVMCHVEGSFQSAL